MEKVGLVSRLAAKVGVKVEIKSGSYSAQRQVSPGDKGHSSLGKFLSVPVSPAPSSLTFLENPQKVPWNHACWLVLPLPKLPCLFDPPLCISHYRSKYCWHDPLSQFILAEQMQTTGLFSWFLQLSKVGQILKETLPQHTALPTTKALFTLLISLQFVSNARHWMCLFIFAPQKSGSDTVKPDG